MTFPVAGGDRLPASIINALTNSSAAINAQALSAGASETTTSATFVNCAGTGSVTSFTWTKYRDDTAAALFIGASFQPTTANAFARFGLSIDGTDYELAGAAPGTGVMSMCFGIDVVSDIAAGIYTVQCRWRRAAGSGTCQRNENNWLSAGCIELPTLSP